MQDIYCVMTYICYNRFEVIRHMKNKMKIARLQIGLTQEDLAKKVGVTRQTISLIENSKYNPSLNLCLEICYTLNKTLDDLFWREEEEKR